MRLLEMVDLADMPGRVGELEADALAMAAGRETPALDHCDRVRHVRMRRIMRNRVDTGLGDDFSGRISIILCVRVRFAPDSPLEGTGFEPSVPRDTTNLSSRLWLVPANRKVGAKENHEASGPSPRGTDRRSRAGGEAWQLRADALSPRLTISALLSKPTAGTVRC